MQNMATLEEFYTSIRDDGRYETDAATCRRAARAGMVAGLRFYFGALGGVIVTGNRRLRRKHFSPDTLGELSWTLLHGAEKLGAKVSFAGFENLAELEERPAVIVANHMSLIETMVLPAGVFAHGRMIIVAKRSLTRYPAFGKILTASKPILLDRKNPRQDLAEVLKQGEASLAAGTSVLLFPQGTRMDVFNPARFNSLGAKLAIRAKVPLIPVACKTDFARPGRLMRDFGPIDPSLPVKFEAGKPLDAAALGQRQVQEQSVGHIVGCLRKWDMPVIEQSGEG